MSGWFTLLLLPAIALVLHVEAAPPNVILVVSDDQGYGELGSQPHRGRAPPTPNLDRLPLSSMARDRSSGSSTSPRNSPIGPSHSCADRPPVLFCLYLAYNAVHAPLEAPAELVARHGGDVRRAMVAALDEGVGRLLGELRALHKTWAKSQPPRSGGAADSNRATRTKKE